LEAATAIAMSVTAHQTRLLFDKVKGRHPQAPAAGEGEAAGCHEPGAT